MIYTVVWAESAAAELAAIWLASTDRRLITALARENDEQLRVAPDASGESRGPDLRILIAGSLAVTYTVRPDDRLVKVLDAWTLSRD